MSDERLMDLARYARVYLHDERLITDDEYMDLLADSQGGQRVARLAKYDDVRKRAEKAETRVAELEADALRLDKVERMRITLVPSADDDDEVWVVAWDPHGCADIDKPTVRAAIDAVEEP